MTTLLNVAVAAYTVTAVALAWLGVMAWRRSRRPRTGVLAMGMVVFALAGLTTSWWMFQREGVEDIFALHASLTAVGLLVIYVALVKR